MIVFDRLLAGAALVFLSPVLALAGLSVKLSSRGPVLYRAQRAGKDGQPFTMFKFRTMRVGSSSGGAITAARDSRVFPVGAALRRTKIDELPQLVNVVRGEMALVGPRPEDVEIVREHYDDFMRESLLVRPGVTGPGSLHYFADEDQLPEDPADALAFYLDNLLARKIALDLVFVRNPRFIYELSLLIRTLGGIVGRSRWFEAQAARELEMAAAILQERQDA
jgi:lipopolysaccharide/colanic/teichoic acid biosynthesis glycosyltransferase